MANLKIKLVKSLNGRLDSHIATAYSLGLHKIGNETVQPDNPQTRGKIAKIGYLLKVEEEPPDPRQDRQDRLSAEGRRRIRRAKRMYIHDLSPVAGSTHVDKRKGRGHATGNGKTAGRGHKGQKARSGGGTRIGFEGGQMPLARRIPKRGFNNIFAKPLESLNVDVLNKFDDGAVVDAQALLDAGILSKCRYGVKFLGNGELTKNVTVKAAAFSETAKQKIEAAGGKAEVV